MQERLGITVNDTVPAPGCHGTAGQVIWNGQGTAPPVFAGTCAQLGNNPAGPGTNSVTIGSASPGVVALLALYPLPNLPSNGYTTPYTQPDRDVYGQIRVDQIFSDKDSAFVRYTVDDDDTVLALGHPEYFVNPRLSRHQYATLSENHLFSTSLLNNIRFSFSRTASFRSSPDPFTGPLYSMMAGQPMGPIAVGGLIGGMGPIANPPAVQNQNILTLSDDVAYTVGRHSLKFGTDINSYRQYGLQNMKVEGQLNFSSLATFLQGNASAYSGVLPASNTRRTWQFYTTGFYVQDDWRVRSNFTVNAGLRYEPAPNYYHEVFGVSSALINPLTDTSLTVGPLFLNPTLHNFSPRLGFAWDVWGNGKTSVRGGGSLMYDLAGFFNGLYNIYNSQPPFSFIDVGSGTFTLPFTFGTSAVSATASSADYHLKQSRIYSENLTVEQQLPFTMVLSVSYVGSRGEHLPTTGEADPNVPMGFTTSGLPFWNPNTAVTIAKTNPTWNTVNYFNSNSDSVYHALQVVVTKRLTHGLQFQSSYTWAKLLDNTQGDGASDCTSSSTYQTDPYSSRFDRGPACFNIPQVWVFNAIYNLPSPKIQERVLAALTSRWGVTGIYTLRSGFPFNPSVSANRSRSGVTGGVTTGIDRPNYNPAFTGNIIEGDPAQWFNPAAFMLQPVGTLGNVPRDGLLGPHFNEFNFAVKKETKLGFLGEAGNLTFRAEFFNLFNHPNFAMPNQSTFAGTLGDPITETPQGTAGQITTTSGTSRQVEFSLRVSF